MEIFEALKLEVEARYGLLISNDDLRIALGYPTMEAFRQALYRNTVPVPVFSIPNRRGKFALSKDVAEWLANQRNAALAAMQGK